MKLEQLVEVCRRFNNANVRYVLVGGFAVVLHGYERATGDIDFLVDSSSDNIQKVRLALRDLLPEACEELRSEDVQEMVVVRMIGETLVIDLMKQIGPFDYEAVNRDRFVEEIDGVRIPVASLDSMIRLKEGVRERDRRDYIFLKGKKEYLERRVSKTGETGSSRRAGWWSWLGRLFDIW